MLDAMMRPFIRPIAVLWLAALAVAGCGGSSGNGAANAHSASPKHSSPPAHAGPTQLDVEVGLLPTSVTTDGTRLWTLNGGDSTLSRIEGDPPAVTGVSPAGHMPMGAVYANGSLWVADATPAAVVEFDPETGARGRTIPLDGAPATIAASPGGHDLWVLDSESGWVWHVRPDEGRADAVRIDGRPAAVAVDDSAAWVVTMRGDLFRIAPDGEHIVARIPVGGGGVQVLATGDAVWVPQIKRDRVVRVDARTNTVTAVIRLPAHATGIAQFRGAIWVCAAGSPSLFELDPDTGSVLGTQKLQNQNDGWWLLALGDDLWVLQLYSPYGASDSGLPGVLTRVRFPA
jgi:DNA-binding beta-propeller fold protein YncE